VHFSPIFARLTPVLSVLSRWVAWAFLWVGILLGLAWGTLHFWIVPRIADFRPAIERMAGQAVGVPVQIGAISAASTGWAPSFELNELALLDPAGRVALRLPKVVIAISVRSVLRLQLEQLVLDKPELDVRREANGQWRIAGMSGAPEQSSAAADWLFSQREIIVRGGTLNWTDEYTPTATNPPATLSLRDVDLVVRNSARHHDIRVDATPPADWGARFVTMGRFKRGLLSIHPGQWSDWTGQTYTYFPQVDVAPWHPLMPAGLGVSSGQGSLRAWADVVNGQWAGGVADVNLTQVQVRMTTDEKPMLFERLSGRLGGRIHDLGFDVSTQHLAFVSNEGLTWPGGNVALEYRHAQGKKPAQGVLQADQLDLQALREMGLRLPLPAPWRERLLAQKISGQIAALKWRWQGDWPSPDEFDGQITLTDVHLPVRTDAASGSGVRWPGVQGAQAKLSVNQDGGQVEINMGADGAVFLPGILEEPELRVQALRAKATFKREGHLWHVPQWQLQLTHPDLQGQWQGQWHAANDGVGPGVLDLQGQIRQLEAARAYRFLPAALPADVRQYVRQAFVKGSYTDVQIKLKGDLSRMPFTDPKDGEFRVAGRLRDVEWDFWPASLSSTPGNPWPRLHKLNGKLAFDRAGLALSEGSARAVDARSGLILTAIQADIADMTHNPVLNVSAENKGPAAQWLSLVQKSPLDGLTAGTFRQTQATGNLQTRFKLAIPLGASHTTKVQGAVVLAGNDLRMMPGLPVLEKSQGTVQFTEAGFTLSGVQARLLGGPVRIEGGMRPTSAAANAESNLQLRAQGQITAEGLRAAKEFAPLQAWAAQASGATTYSAQLGWRQGQPELAIQSQLDGLALKLPFPLGKPAASSQPVSLRMQVESSGTNLRDQLQLEWGQVAWATFVRDLSGPTPVVLRGSMSLGLPKAQAPALPNSGISATVALDTLNVEDWQQLLPTAAATGLAPTPSNLTNPVTVWQNYLPTRINLQAKSITADGRTLNQVVAGGVREGNTWRVNVEARELNGNVVYRQPAGVQQGHLYARLTRLNLPPSSVADVEGLLEAPPLNLPSLDIVVDQLELRGKKLGRIEIEAVNTDPARSRVRSAPEWQLNKFNITVPEATFQSTGRWSTALDSANQRRTEINFKMDVSDAGALLTRLGTPNALRGGSGQMEGQVRWQGSPLALHYPSMSGQLGIKMGRGQFLKADAGAAKLLGVLSLQALPRRLLLDFRDVFYEGFAFDSARGDVTIAQGIATTRNLQIKGVNALVQLDGSADIAQETQKLRVVILPALDAGTASLVAGIAVNPVVGLTAFLAQLFLQNPLAKASTQEFLIDGSWAEPRVTKVNTTPDKPASANTPP